RAAPDGNRLDALFRGGAARAGVAAHARAVQADALRIDVGTGDEVVDHRFGDALGIRRRVELVMAQGAALPRTVDVDKRHAAAHVLPGAAVFAAEQNPVGAAVVVNHGQLRSGFAAPGPEVRRQLVSFVGDFHALEGRRDEAPGLREILFE